MEMRNELDLLEASAIGNMERVSSLLSSGVDPNFQNKVNGWTCLHWASKRNHIDIVKLLLSFGANAQLQNRDGQIPMELTNVEELKTLFNVTKPIFVSCESQSTLPVESPVATPHATPLASPKLVHGSDDIVHSKEFHMNEIIEKKVYIYKNVKSGNSILGVLHLKETAILLDLKKQIVLEIDEISQVFSTRLYRLDPLLNMLIPLNEKQLNQSVTRHFDFNSEYLDVIVKMNEIT